MRGKLGLSSTYFTQRLNRSGWSTGALRGREGVLAVVPELQERPGLKVGVYRGVIVVAEDAVDQAEHVLPGDREVAVHEQLRVGLGVLAIVGDDIDGALADVDRMVHRVAEGDDRLGEAVAEA